MSSKTVLIVDDDADHRDTAGAMLRTLVEENVIIKEAVDGQDALNKFDANVALVISDLNMPKVRGIDLLRRLREQGFQVPFILRSSMMEEGARVEAEKLGAHCFWKLQEDDEMFADAAKILGS